MNHPIDYTQPRKSRKLPKHFSPVAFAFFMSSIMALLMCTVIVAVSGGVTGDFAWRVGKAYMLAMPVAFCCVLLVRPLVVRLVTLTVQS